MCNCTPPSFSRRPFGTEPEFFIQLFVEPDKSLKVPTIEILLKKMFKEQQISFAEVSLFSILDNLNFTHCVYICRFLQSC